MIDSRKKLSQDLLQYPLSLRIGHLKVKFCRLLPGENAVILFLFSLLILAAAAAVLLVVIIRSREML